MVRFAGDAARQVGQEIERRRANIVDGDIAAQRRVQFVPFQNIAEIANAAGGQGLDRALPKSRSR